MFEVTNQISLRAPRSAVWGVIADLANYRNWHPTISFKGTADFNAVIEYGYNGTVAGIDEPSAPARIVSYDAPTRIGWRLGIPVLGWADEWYRLADGGENTLIEHGVRCSGPISWLLKRFAARRLRAVIEAADAALAAHLNGLSRLCTTCGKVHNLTRNQRRLRRH